MTPALDAFLERLGVRAAHRLGPATPLTSAPRILVLRNNDLGDVLVVTPLFEGLKRLFPQSHLAVGVGQWALPLLRGNPHIDACLRVDAPWFNKYTKTGALRAWQFLNGPQVRTLEAGRFDLGIDVLGSTWGSLLLLRAGIRNRLGRTGFAGGSQSATGTIHHSQEEPVGRNALRFAEILGATDLPSTRPQLYLSQTELNSGHLFWAASGRSTGKRWLVSPGAGLPNKAWPEPSFRALTRELTRAETADVAVVFGPKETELARRIVASAPRARLAPADCSIRELASIVAASDCVVCNSSLVLHLAAAFDVPAVVVLGPSFPSAREHQVMWGHPRSVSLGGRPGVRREVASVEEALEALQRLAGGARDS